MKERLSRAWERWKRIAHRIGRFQTRVILTVFYFTVVGSTWVIMKLLRKDPLNRRFNLEASYWTDHEAVGPESERLKRQF